MSHPTVLAFHLPQFHCIPENDAWWGEGFTEWTNVRKATPAYPGHRQPRVPAGGRYYDLLDDDVQDWQAELARGHGIGGFCYYHYWFEGGRRLLEKPLEAILRRGKPDFPFCFAWANEPWTRTWDGGHDQVLMPQGYGGPKDWALHFEALRRAFDDPRYIRVGGAPLLLIYRTTSIQDCAAMLDCWRDLARRSGYPDLHIVSMITTFGEDPRADLFDAYVEFEPFFSKINRKLTSKVYEKFFNALHGLSAKHLGRARVAPNSLDYEVLWREIARRRPLPNHYPGAFVDWDNSPRKHIDSSLVLRNVSVETFRDGFRALYRNASKAGVPFIFVNAWNEWAEGTYLEPDEEHGTAFLEAIRSVVTAGEGVEPKGVSLAA